MGFSFLIPFVFMTLSYPEIEHRSGFHYSFTTKNLTKLQKLKLFSCNKITDNSLIKIANNFTNLQEIKLQESYVKAIEDKDNVITVRKRGRPKINKN